MPSNILSFFTQNLTKPTPVFGIKLWVLIALAVSLIVFIIIAILCLYFTHCRRRKKPYKAHKVNDFNKFYQNSYNNSRTDSSQLDHQSKLVSSNNSGTINRTVDIESPVINAWRKLFSLAEIEFATNQLDKQNVIGHGDYGTVFHGVLCDETRVAVKKLLVNSCRAEEFVTRAEEIGHVRHKNLVNLLGYCMEGSHRMLVYEYIDNKSLHYWLHQCPDQLNSLTWTARMNIIYGIAKGLAYLHEGIEERILHGSLKSSSVMLDNQFNPKLTDFGLAKLFGPQWGYILMDSLGYVAPENYASPYDFTERNDVYSFGILIMEIVTGRVPMDRRKSQPYLIDWVKSMVTSGNIGNVVDRNLDETPSAMELKRIVLIALRCVDPDEEHRPTIEEVTLMFEPRDLLLGDDELQFLSSI